MCAVKMLKKILFNSWEKKYSDSDFLILKMLK